jgi:hypothetical protein
MTQQILTAFSVGFIPVEWTDNPHAKANEPKRIYTKCKLLEVSLVPIPSNVGAVVQELSKVARCESVTKALNMLKSPRTVEIGEEDLAEMLRPMLKEANEEMFAGILEEMREYTRLALRRAMGKAF